MAGNETGSGSDVDATFQNANHVVDIRPLRVIDNAIGLQCQQRIDVVCCEHTNGVDAAQLTNVAPDLVWSPGITTDDLKFRIRNRRNHRTLADVARRPLHYPIYPR